jgi:ectoine hydroxylase-related dioxygenase (phytanoyl-CoA dioxygenase family)
MVQAFELFETDALAAAMEADGCTRVRAALPPATVAAARAAVDALVPVHWDEHGAMDRYKNVFNRDPFWLPFLDRPGLIELAERLLGPDCRVIGQTAWRTHPGYRAEALHLDYLPFEAPEQAFAAGLLRVAPFIVTVQFYLCDVPVELGATQVVAGSHRAGRAPQAGERDWNGRSPEAVPCAAGDALAFRSELWHRGGDNATRDRVRYVLQVHYARREMAPHFSPYLDWRFDRNVIAAATPRQRRLLGDHPPGAFD